MFDNKKIRIDSVDIGNIGDVVAFKIFTSEGDMHLNMSTDSAKSMISLLENTVAKIETGDYLSEEIVDTRKEILDTDILDAGEAPE